MRSALFDMFRARVNEFFAEYYFGKLITELPREDLRNSELVALYAERALNILEQRKIHNSGGVFNRVNRLYDLLDASNTFLNTCEIE